METNTSIRECDFAIHWNSEKGYGMGATDMHVSCTSVYKHEMTCMLWWHRPSQWANSFLFDKVWFLVPSRNPWPQATWSRVSWLRSPFCSVFSFWKRCLRPFPSSVSSCTTSELIAGPSQDLTESDHIFFSGMGLFAFSLTVWACLWSSVFHYNYFIYTYVNIFRSIEPVSCTSWIVLKLSSCSEITK